MKPSHAVSQICLRPFDVGVALRLLLVPEERYEPLSHALATSTSAVHRSVGRLRLARICEPDSRTIDHAAFVEFATCCVPYTFPHMRERSGRGLSTASSHPELARFQGANAFVWTSNRHDNEGLVIVPLFAGVVQVAALDDRMHHLLSIIELLRIADRNDRQPVREYLDEVLSALV